MGKHKQTKRERKFGIKGGVKARLENGGTIVSKGKKKNFNKKRKNASQDKEVIAAKLQKRAEKNAEEYQQQQKALRDAEDFTGRGNLGDLDVNSFFTSLEEELKGGGDALLSSSDEEEIGGDDESSDEEKEPIKSDLKQKKKEGSESGSHSDSDSDDSDSEEEKGDPPRKKKAKAKAQSEPSKKSDAAKADNNDKKKKAKESSSSSSSSSSDDDDSESSDDSSSSSDDKPTNKKQQRQNKAKQAESNTNSKKKASSSDSDDSDSDDDDIEAAEARMKAEMKKLESQDPDFHEFLKENEQSLLEFGEDDDEEDAADQAMEEEEEDEMDEDEEAQPSKSKKDDRNKKKNDDDDNAIELTHKMLNQMSKGAFYEHGIKSLKKLLKAYKSACRVATNSSAEDDEDDMAGSKGKKKKKARQATHEKTYRIESSKVFDQLMVTCLGKCHEAFYFHLLATDEEKQPQKANGNNKKSKHKPPTKGKNAKKNKRQDDSSDDDSESHSDSDSDEMETEEKNDNDENDKEEEAEESLDEKPLDPKVLERSEKWVDVKPLLNLFLRSTLHLISESKEPDLLSIVLKSLDKYIRYMTPFPRLAEALLKTLVGLWSAPLGDASADYQVVRLNAFLRIRQLALTQPFPFIETCLKKTYLAYARRAKFGGDSASVMSNTLPTLTFMGNCLVELYSLDHASSYQHAFVYIRQLALLLRAYMQKKTKEAAQQVFCWQFLHCLKLWVAVLATCCKQVRDGGDGKNDATIMKELVYPLTEIILGVCRLMPAPARYVPLRFHCVRLCQQLAAASEKFIPTTSLLMPVLDLKEVNVKPKKIKSRGANTRGVQLQFLLRLPKDDPLRTAEEQEAVMAEIFKLLNRELDLYRYSPGFPEFQFNVNQRLKKFIKNTKNSRWRAYARGSVDMCERYMDFAVTARSKLTVAPKDVKTLECIRPAREPSMGDRYAAAVEKENKEWTSLISATSTTTTPSEAKKETNDADDDVEQPKKKKKAKRSKQSKQPKPSVPRPPAAGDDDVMDIEDTVEEGVEWSDEDA